MHVGDGLQANFTLQTILPQDLDARMSQLGSRLKELASMGDRVHLDLNEVRATMQHEFQSGQVSVSSSSIAIPEGWKNISSGVVQRNSLNEQLVLPPRF